MKHITKIFKYIEPIWLGADGRMSIRRVLALVFSVNFIYNFQFMVVNWSETQSMADSALILGIEAGLITALLSLTTYSSSLPKPK